MDLKAVHVSLCSFIGYWSWIMVSQVMYQQPLFVTTHLLFRLQIIMSNMRINQLLMLSSQSNSQLVVLIGNTLLVAFCLSCMPLIFF
jgi:hypothetical protein